MKKSMRPQQATGALIFTALAILSGCGPNNQSAAPIAAVPAAVVPGGGIGLPGGCVPLAQGGQIGFTASGMNFINNRVQAGFIKPLNQNVGVVTLTPGFGAQPFPGQPLPGQQFPVQPGINPGFGYGSTYRATNLYSGTQIILSIQNGGAGGMYNPTFPTTGFGQAMGNGTISLGANFVQGLMQRAFEISAGGGLAGAPTGMPGNFIPGIPSYGPGGFPQAGFPQAGFPQGAAQTACISSIGIDLSATLYSGMLINGSVYFYLNGTQSGLALDF